MFDTLASRRGRTVAASRANTMFGHVMGLVALTVGCCTLGAYLGRNQIHSHGFLFMIGAVACIIGLNVAAARGHEQLSVGLLFGMGLLLGFGVAPLLTYYAKTEPSVLYQAVGCTALLCACLGAYGYATRRDLAVWGRTLFWALLGLLVLGLIVTLIRIPHGHLIYSIASLGIFGAYTVFDFNRLARTRDFRAAAPIAAAIFLDIFNVFLSLLNILGRND